MAEENGSLAGYLLFSKGYNGLYVRYFYVVDLYVKSNMRGRGVGRILMDAVCGIARGEGITLVSWSVHKNNLDAIAFYERLGAKCVEDCHRMYLELI